MSAISSVSSNSNLYQFLQNLQQSSGLGSAAGGSSGVQGAHHHRHGGGGGGGLMSQIQNAVTSALQSAQSSGSTTDPNQVVQNAIAQVLQNGSTTGTSATTSTAGTAAAGSTTGSSPQAFFQTLQASGVTPQQFLNDFMAALQSTQSTQLNAGTLTGNLVNATA